MIKTLGISAFEDGGEKARVNKMLCRKPSYCRATDARQRIPTRNGDKYAEMLRRMVKKHSSNREHEHCGHLEATLMSSSPSSCAKLNLETKKYCLLIVKFKINT